MIKNTSVNTALAIGTAAAFSTSVLSGRPSDPITRWSPGSLAATVMGNSDLPLLVLISATQLVALTKDGAESYQGDIADIFNGADGGGAMLTFVPGESETKSRTVSVAGITPGITLKDAGNADVAADSILGKILRPTLPVYTALSLMNALESASGSDPFVIALDQLTGNVTFIPFESAAQADAAIAAMAGVQDFEVVAAYLMDGGSSSGSSTAGKWGWE